MLKDKNNDANLTISCKAIDCLIDFWQWSLRNNFGKFRKRIILWHLKLRRLTRCGSMKFNIIFRPQKRDIYHLKAETFYFLMSIEFKSVSMQKLAFLHKKLILQSVSAIENMIFQNMFNYRLVGYQMSQNVLGWLNFNIFKVLESLLLL